MKSQSLCIMDDEIPRDGGRWPEYTSTMLVCFSGWEGGVACGALWAFYFKNPRLFRGLDQLLFAMESVMDEAKHPQAWYERPNLSLCGKRQRYSKEKPDSAASMARMTPYHPPDGLAQTRGRLCTVAVRVYCRQHASMQGKARLLNGGNVVCFRSALELLHLLQEMLEQTDGTRR